jgi:K+-sensing histidine kinase KdpD
MTAEHMDRQLGRYLPSEDLALEFRGRIVLCVPVTRGLEGRIRAVAAYAASQGSRLSVVTVRTRSLTDEEKSWLGAYASLTHQLGGEFTRLEGNSVSPVIVRFVRESQGTEVVLGHRRAGAWRPWDTTSEVIRSLSGVDVHILHSDRITAV